MRQTSRGIGSETDKGEERDGVSETEERQRE